MSKPQIYTIVAIIFLLLIAMSANGATLQKSYYSGINTWDYNAKVFTGAFDATGDDSFSSYLPDVDACIITYLDQVAITKTPGWAYSTGNATITTEGDANETYWVWVFDLPGY